ncbi:uncharacterized protein LOC119188596 [Manduca sexta]|uniref:uncharacterized protein LOC119188596 n=1 Tax=Manduca sexta TaxID=7130 RepID=UPI00188F1E9D|nr:uncharacterized protein LOC119188596 [Manduca sexta]
MAPRPSAPSLSIPAEDIPEVSPGELQVAVSRLRSKNSLRGSTVYPDVSGSSLSSHWVRGSVAFSPRALSRALSVAVEDGEACPAQERRRPAESPSAYRPIVLLDEVCKLFERVVHARLVGHLERIGPDLAACQYGFRRGRSTIHAILRVKALAEDAVARGRVVLAVSLDIANAFNTMPWACINEALRYHEVPPYLRRLGSVLGPLLWNIGYDWVLRGTNLRGVAVVCYADDTLVTATARTFQRASLLASFGTELVVRRIRRLGLAVALHKTEALAFHGPRSRPPIEAYISVEGVRIPVGSKMKYLGLHLDSRWDFRAHFEVSLAEVGCCEDRSAWWRSVSSGATARSHTKRLAYWRALCPGISTRGLSSVFWWREESLRRGQRLAPQEVETTLVSLRNAAVEEWQLRLESPSAGLRTVAAVRPVLRQWLDRHHGAPTFRLTQVLTGHGCFGAYLCRIAGKEESAACHHCGNCREDTAQHTLEECPAWTEERSALLAVIGSDLSLPTVVAAMVRSRRSWRAMASFCERAMSQKEAAERIGADRSRPPPP